MDINNDISNKYKIILVKNINNIFEYLSMHLKKIIFIN